MVQNKTVKKVTVKIIVVALMVTYLLGQSNLTTVNAASRTRLESISVSGGCFNTGIKINQNYSIEMTFSLSSLSQYRNIFLAESSRYPVYRLRLEAGNGLYAAHGWYNIKVFTPKVNQDITILQKKNVTYINGKQVMKATVQSLTAVSNLTFGNFNGTIKAFKLWDEQGSLVVNYEPAKDVSGRACLYDTVNDKFIYYSGNCTAGTEVEKIEEIEEEIEDTEETEDKKEIEEEIEETVETPTLGATQNKELTQNQQAVYDIVKELLVNNDSTRKTLTQYKLTYNEVKNDIWEQVKNDCFLEYHASAAAFLTVGRSSDGYATYCELWNTDSGYAARLKKLTTVKDNFVKQLEPSMSDADKVLLAHEYIVDNCQYYNDGSTSYSAGGALVNGKAICGGYTNALIFLLHYAGVEAESVSSASINHTWAYVKVDGQWYHVDPTWDDTRKSSSGVGQHRFLLVNDSEIQNISEGKHYNWSVDSGSTITSTSGIYSQWFVHKVAGSMYYYNGLWYYYDSSDKSIKASEIDGSNCQVIVSSSVTSGITGITGINGGVLKYTANGSTYTKNL